MGRILRILLLLILFSAELSCNKKDLTDERLVNKKDSSTLLISGENFPPYLYEENSVIKGINAEIYRYIFKELDIEYRIEIYPWSRVWKMAQIGRIDAVDSTSHKKYREPFLLYTEEQKHFPEIIPGDNLFMTEYVFFIRKIYKDLLPADFTLEEIKEKGYRIGIIRDNSYFEDFWKYNFDITKYPDVEHSLRALASGEIDLYPIDKTIGLFTAGKTGLDKELIFHPKILHSKPQYLLFVKKSPRKDIAELQGKFNNALIEFKKTDIYRNIYNKYTYSFN